MAGSGFHSLYAFGDKVLIDGDDSLKAVVTGFNFRRCGYSQVELSWIHNGSYSVWFEDWRISLA